MRFLTWCSSRVSFAALFAAALVAGGAALSVREPQVEVGVALIVAASAAALLAIGAWIVPLVSDPWRAPRGRRRRH